MSTSFLPYYLYSSSAYGAAVRVTYARNNTYRYKKDGALLLHGPITLHKNRNKMPLESLDLALALYLPTLSYTSRQNLWWSVLLVRRKLPDKFRERYWLPRKW